MKWYFLVGSIWLFSSNGATNICWRSFHWRDHHHQHLQRCFEICKCKLQLGYFDMKCEIALFNTMLTFKAMESILLTTDGDFGHVTPSDDPHYRFILTNSQRTKLTKWHSKCEEKHISTFIYIINNIIHEQWRDFSVFHHGITEVGVNDFPVILQLSVLLYGEATVDSQDKVRLMGVSLSYYWLLLFEK